MEHQSFQNLPEDRRVAVAKALAAAFGAASASGVQPVLGGASGALAYRLETGGRPYLLRVEGPRHGGLRNPHQYACMKIAAEAGVAPPLRHVDEAAGVAVMDFIAARPLGDFPGGPVALAQAAGALIARLQATPLFPAFADYPEIAARLLAHVQAAGGFAPGLFDAHAEGLARIREACPWEAERLVSSHNDPNPRNWLFDGERLWLIDWETAHRNDPLVDVAILTHELAATPELEGAMLRAWRGREPDAALRARLRLVRLLTNLHYGALLLSIAPAAPGAEPDTDLSAPTPEAFGAEVMSGRLPMGSPQMLRTLGKMSLKAFLEGVRGPEFEPALALAEGA